MKKNALFALGIILMSIGLVGYIVPILPGTVFMILAAYCFLYSSEKFYNKIINNKSYGKPIKDYIEKNYISLHSKFYILAVIWVASLISIYFIGLNIYLTTITIFLSISGSVLIMKAKS
tara:strand:+ start:116 stop:472 length:357 start_codon:yes stop_codon:yes gene_type:complete